MIQIVSLKASALVVGSSFSEEPFGKGVALFCTYTPALQVIKFLNICRAELILCLQTALTGGISR